MKPAFIDANVFLYANGRKHPLREPCRAVVAALTEGRVKGSVNSEIIQEIAHVGSRGKRSRQPGVQLARRVMVLCETHPVDTEDMTRALDLFEHLRRLSMRDSVHAASALNHGIKEIISADRGFDAVPGLKRIDPRKFS